MHPDCSSHRICKDPQQSHPTQTQRLSVSNRGVCPTTNPRHKAQRSLSLESIRGIEGTAARLYFQHFASMIKIDGLDFSFDSRNRRPPRDPINALLSFGYGCLYREVTMGHPTSGAGPVDGLSTRPRIWPRLAGTGYDGRISSHSGGQHRPEHGEQQSSSISGF